MVSISTAVRKIPARTLRKYFASKDISLEEVPWDGDTKSVAKPLLKAIESLDADTHARVTNDFGRVGALSDEPGQLAIDGVVTDEVPDDIETGFERAMWLFTQEPRLFQRAEEVRYTDDRRRGRHWDGFRSEADIDPRRDESAVAAFKRAITERFGSRNVHIDIFDRSRTTSDGTVSALIQATVYSEGRFEEYFEFVEGQLDVRGRHPVIEACLTYEPDPGVIEVVARDRPTREDYVRLFARNLLGISYEEGERVQLREYDLTSLLMPQVFPTDPQDGIESVRLNSLRLMPWDTTSERVTIECLRGGKRTIWELSSERFGEGNPLSDGWIVTQARLTIQFHPEKGASRGKVLPLTITMPHGCDLKDRTDQERLIGEKYLRAWQLVREY